MTSCLQIRYAFAAVPHVEPQHAAPLDIFDLDLYFPFESELNSISNDVREYLANARFILNDMLRDAIALNEFEKQFLLKRHGPENILQFSEGVPQAEFALYSPKLTRLNFGKILCIKLISQSVLAYHDVCDLPIH